MFDNPDVVGLVHGWVEKAEHDLTMAKAGLKLNEAVFTKHRVAIDLR